MDSVDFNIADFPTKSVTFTPTTAAVVREIPVPIQPGPNEITVTGLDPRVDQDSIRIDGSGPATITDLQTATVPRVEEFDDVHPASKHEARPESSDGSDSESEGNDLQAVKNDLHAAESGLTEARNNIASCLSELRVLDAYGNSLDPKVVGVSALDEFLDLYRRRREEGSRLHVRACGEVSRREGDVRRLSRKKGRIERAAARGKERREKNGVRRREKRAFELGRREKARKWARDEKRKFWTASLAKVTVRLDGDLDSATPGSSRRGSVTEAAATEAILHLSYALPAPLASWTPRYDLAITTSPTPSTRLVYRAQFRNSSAETWRDVRAVFSSSQAQFSRLDERVPSLRPWRVRLSRSLFTSATGTHSTDWRNVLRSRDEKQKTPLEARYDAQRAVVRGEKVTANSLPLSLPNAPGGLLQGQGQSASTGILEGASQHPWDSSLFGGGFRPLPQRPSGALFGGGGYQQQPQQPSGPLFGQAQPQGSSSLFGGAQSQSQPSSLFGGVQHQGQSSSAFGPAAQGQSSSGFCQAAQVQPTAQPAQPDDPAQEPPYESAPSPSPSPDPDIDTPLHHQSATLTQTGLTTTYTPFSGGKIPQIAPSTTPHHQLLSTLTLPTTLSYTIVPKHRAAAFFAAKIKNTSDITLLRGAAGVTVDESFLGSVPGESLFWAGSSALKTTSKPACAPGESLDLSLGTDPSIGVTYSVPFVKKGSAPESAGMGGVAGFFTRKTAEDKGETAVFRRVCTVRNSKPRPVDLVVIEQVPVSDEKDTGKDTDTDNEKDEESLDITIREPAGLAKEGDKADFKPTGGAGSGTVSLGKNGAVRWAVCLVPREEERFVLEYEVRAPAGPDVVEV